MVDFTLRRISRLLAFSLLLVLIVFAPRSARSAEGGDASSDASRPRADEKNAVERNAVEGRYRYAGGAAEDALRKAAIDRAIGDMFFAIRPIARHRLGNATRILPWISFSFSGGQIRTRGPESLDLQSPDGSTILHTWRGEKSRATQRLTTNGVMQRFVADDGTGQSEWRLSPDGSTLTLRVTITSPRLPTPVVFSLTYRREA